MSYPNNEQIQEIIEHIGNNLHVPQMVQHFDTSMIFDTEERMVGQWVDGKPIYRTVVSGVTPNNTNSEISITLPANRDMSFLENFIVTNSAGYTGNISFADNFGADINKTGDGIWFTTNNTENWGNRPFIATILYTKTTDTALTYKLGTENDYSTEERLIGTWIDGNDLFRICKTVTLPSSGDIDLGLAATYKVKNFRAIMSTAGNELVVNNDYIAGAKPSFFFQSSNTLHFTDDGQFAGRSAEIVVEYTKA